MKDTEQGLHSNLTSLASILIGGGALFAAFFILGYLHLTLYFWRFGPLVPIYELESISTARIGFFQFFTIDLLPLLLACWFLKKYCQKRLLIIIGVILFLLASSIFIPILISKYDKDFNSTWLSFIFGESVPNVEIIYKVPLANTQLPTGNSLGNHLTEKKEKEIKSQDKPFYDEMGNRHYVAQFKLYFESRDNYYLRSKANFCELYGLLAREALKGEKGLSSEEGMKLIPLVYVLSTQPALTVSTSSMEISPEVLATYNWDPDTYIIEPLDIDLPTSEEEKEYENKRQCRLIILPKTQVESLKYYR